MFETTIAGSLPKPAWLAEPEKLWAPWRLEGEELERGKRDAALVWLSEQEAAGIDVITNGEQFREHFVHGFLKHVEGIDWNKMTTMGIRDDRYDADVPTVTGPVKRIGKVHSEEVRFTRAHTTKNLKFTLPGPMTICDTIAPAGCGRTGHWRDRDPAVMDHHAAVPWNHANGLAVIAALDNMIR